MKTRIYAIALLLGATTGMQAQFTVTIGSQSQSTTGNSAIQFSQDGSNDRWSLDLFGTGTYNSVLDVSTLTSITMTPLATRLQQYAAPAYADDYRTLAGWNDRARWNLANVHDPTVMRADDGYYYMYQTDASFGNAHDGHGHFHGRRSRDLVNWEYLGGTMAETPAWVLDSLNAFRQEMGLPAVTQPQYGYWAPCARRVRAGLYRMYYCIVVDNYIQSGRPATSAFDGSWGERAFIGVMETSDPASNQWQDKGFVICSSSDKFWNYKRSDTNNWEAYFYFNAIDPTYIITPEGEHWLIYGSWHSGFAAVQMNPETGKTLQPLGKPWATGAAQLAQNGYGRRVFSRGTSRWQGSEAPEVVYHDGYYYLFMAYDGLDIPYNTRVVRSEHIDGPYYNILGEEVTNGGDALPMVTHPYKFSNDAGWVGISHCAVFDDGNGHWYYASQGRFPTDYPVDTQWAPNAVMLGHVRQIQWLSSGWPVVMPERYGAVPQAALTSADIVGTWEHIDLGYSYGKQKTADQMTFDANGTITAGIWKGGQWSFDAATGTLTANGVELKVQRECDWESSPRRATIVYAGVNTGNGKAYWGKKK